MGFVTFGGSVTTGGVVGAVVTSVGWGCSVGSGEPVGVVGVFSCSPVVGSVTRVGAEDSVPVTVVGAPDAPTSVGIEFSFGVCLLQAISIAKRQTLSINKKNLFITPHYCVDFSSSIAPL